LPELGIIEGNQQVAMKRGKPTFPSLFTFYSQFAAIHRVSRDISVTAVHPDQHVLNATQNIVARSHFSCMTPFFSTTPKGLRP